MPNGGVNLNTQQASLALGICLKPAPDLEQRNNDLFGVLKLAGYTEGRDLCFRVQGNSSSPSIQKLP